MNKLHILTLSALMSLLLLSGCTQSVESDAQGTSSEIQQISAENLDSILSADYLIAVVKNNQIWLSDSVSPNPVLVYTLNQDELIPNFDLFDIKVSPKNNYLVWYAPQKGLLALDIRAQSLKTLRPANEWLNTNPFFDFGSDGEVVHLVDDQGTVFYTINPATGETTSTPIPFPFGTIFKISPDKQTIIFISAFGQADTMPEFMFTDLNGQNPVRFDTPTLLTNRHMVEWLPDSSGVIMIGGDEREIIFVPKNSTTSQVYFTHPQEEIITQLHIIDDLIYYNTISGRWHVIDTENKTEVGRIPREVAEEIHRPRFIPWHDKQFLIEETLRLDPEQFKRLWISSYIGIKKPIFDSYDEIKIQTSEFEI